MRTAYRSFLVAAIAATVSLALAAIASGALVKSGEITLALDPDTSEALADMGINIEATGKAEFTEAGVTFPLTGDAVGPPPDFKGLVAGAGGLLLSRADGASVKFRGPSMLIGSRKARVYMRVPPDKFLRVTSAKSYEISGSDEELQLEDGEANLSRRTAKLLTQEFGFPFRRGVPIGTFSIDAELTPVD